MGRLASSLITEKSKETQKPVTNFNEGLDACV